MLQSVFVLAVLLLVSDISNSKASSSTTADVSERNNTVTVQPIDSDKVTTNENAQNSSNSMERTSESSKPMSAKANSNSTFESQSNTTNNLPQESSTVNSDNTSISNSKTSQGDVEDSTVEGNTQETKMLTSEDTESSSNNTDSNTQSSVESSTAPLVPESGITPPHYDGSWMDFFLRSHHFQGQYKCNKVAYGFDFIIRSVHQSDPRTLVAFFHDIDGAVLELNGTSTNGQIIVFKLVRVFTPDYRFPLWAEFEITGEIMDNDKGQYFAGNITKHGNLSFSWIHMTKSLGLIETGEAAGTRTAIIIIIPTIIAFLGICGTVAIVCWASKKGYLRNRHTNYRLFQNTQVSYDTDVETVHI